MAVVLKHGPLGHREKMKYNGKVLKMQVYRLGGYAPIKKKVKVRNDQISQLAFAESDRADDKVLAAVKGENVSWCLYITARSRFVGKSKTFKFVIVRKAVFSRKEDRQSMEEAIQFAREVALGVGLHEIRGANDTYLFTREPKSASIGEIVTLLDDQSSDQSGDDEFADDDEDEN